MKEGADGHIEEQLLESLAIDPESLTREERRRIDVHLRICSLCASIAAFFRDIYAHYRTQPDPEPARVEQFLDRLFPLPGIIELTPLGPSHVRPPLPHGFGQIVSADTAAPAEKRYEPLPSLANRDENVLLRMVIDHEEQLLRCYLLADEERKRAFALISLKNDSVHVVTDGAGKAEVALGDIDSTEQGGARVRYPVAEVALSELRADAGTSHFAGCEIKFVPPTLCIRCGTDAHIVGFAVVDAERHVRFLPARPSSEIEIEVSGGDLGGRVLVFEE